MILTKSLKRVAPEDISLCRPRAVSEMLVRAKACQGMDKRLNVNEDIRNVFRYYSYMGVQEKKTMILTFKEF